MTKRRKGKKLNWITMEQIDQEISTVMSKLQTDTHGASLEGKARASALASRYLFEFWKRTRSPQMTLEVAQTKALEAMHQQLIVEERQEDLSALEGEIKEAQSVLRTIQEANNAEANERSIPEVNRVRHEEREGTEHSPPVVSPETPEGQSSGELVETGIQTGEVQPNKRAESTPLTILPADSEVGGGDSVGSPAGTQQDGSGHDAGEHRRGWKESTARGRKRPLEPGDVHVPEVRTEVGDDTGLGHDTLSEVQGEAAVGEMTEEDMKSFREMSGDELDEKIKQMLRSKAEAMENIDGENIKEVSNSNQPKGQGALGTRNQNKIVGMKHCVSCGFEIPGYETICVACKAPQPRIIKP